MKTGDRSKKFPRRGMKRLVIGFINGSLAGNALREFCKIPVRLGAPASSRRVSCRFSQLAGKMPALQWLLQRSLKKLPNDFYGQPNLYCPPAAYAIP
jgi:hypothetical protein